MAHADYDCCAVCDKKMAYQGFSGVDTKQEVCGNCTVNLAKHDVIINNIKELINWIVTEDNDIVEEVLHDIGFSKCHYPNGVDTTVAYYIGIDQFDRNFGV